MPDNLDKLSQTLSDRYTIERELGRGGMATVYLARDLKHDREVALKVLHPELGAVLGAERFLAEIKLTAQLQHPNILPLFDSGEVDGLLYYVMPFVEGESLRDALEREKELSIEHAVQIAGQVAAALDYAHRHGVIHRDIKPENILMHDGQAMVADFGIALAVRNAGGARITETGLSLGTPQYMSPEQAMADRELDARSDVYSLGAVTYEMLAGEPPYTGPSAQAIITRIMTETARPLGQLRPRVPLSVHQAVHRAIEKLPADRFETAAGFATALTASGPTTSPSIPTFASATPSLRGRNLWLLGVVVVGVVAFFLGRWPRGETPSGPTPLRVAISLDRSHIDLSPFGPNFDISPSGDRVVFRLDDGGTTGLWLQSLDRLDGAPVPGSLAPLGGLVGVVGPRFSPDGASVAFGHGGRLLVASLDGGQTKAVADSVVGWGVWGYDGRLYFQHEGTRGLASVPAGGGAVTLLSEPDTARGESAHYVSDVLPNGRGVIFTSNSGPLQLSSIAVLDLETGTTRVLLRGTDARYLASGHLLYSRIDRTLMAVPFDAGRLEITGDPLPVADNVSLGIGGWMELSVSRSGRMLYLRGLGNKGLVRVTRSGQEEVLDPMAGFGGYGSPRISPAGTRVLYERLTQSASGIGDLWLYGLGDGTRTRLTFSGDNTYPAWLPGGDGIMFRANPEGRPTGTADGAFYRLPVDGSEQPAVVLQGNRSYEEVEVTPDDRWMVYRVGDRGRNQNSGLYYAPLSDPTAERPFVDSRFNERGPAISPDGRWVAYTSDESGQDEIYVRPFPGPGGRAQVSVGGGWEARWSRSGRELFYRNNADLVAAEVTGSGGAFGIVRRRPLFNVRTYVNNGNHAQFDVLPGDTAFVFVKTGADALQMVLVTDLFGELRSQ